MNTKIYMWSLLLITILLSSGCISSCSFETAKDRETEEIGMSRGECTEICSDYWKKTGKSNPEIGPMGFYFCNCYTCDETKAGMYKKDSSATQTTKPKQTCIPNWQCSEWSVCTIVGIETRSCQDSNNCGVNDDKPPESQSCIPETRNTSLILYDDFSGNSLDTSKWVELTDSAGYTTEHYLDTTEGKFHIVQNVEKDAEHKFKMTRRMNPGEVLQFDVYYSSGIGNRIFRTTFSGQGIQTLIDCSNCGAIGFWNTEGSIGNQFGHYLIKYEFFENQIKATIIRPDNSVWGETFNITSPTKPYEVLLATGTGNNGLIDIYFDNFYVG